MIQSFGDQTTADIFHGKDTKAARAIDKSLWPVIRRKLDMVNAARDIRDLTVPPANRLHPLKGALKGRHAIRVNDQYRITFRWDAGHAHEVKCEDYHT